MSSVRDIPGFYWDAEKRKYFKIEKNHLAPNGAYSRDAVNAKLAAQKTKDDALATQSREQRGCIRGVETSSFSILSLNARLGCSPKQTLHNLRHTYASSLQDRVIAPDPGLRSITTDDGKLYYVTTNIRGQSMLYEYGSRRAATNNFSRPVAINPSTRTVVKDNNYATFYGDRLEYGALDGTGSVAWELETSIWDIALSRHTCSQIVLATEEGLYVTTDARDSHFIGVIQHEQMCVSMKDTNIAMSGERRGVVNFTDLRNNGTISRLRHPSGVCDISATRQSEQIIVNGMQHVAMYDLRYIKARPKPASSTKRQKNTKGTRQPSEPSTIPLVLFDFPENHRTCFRNSGKSLAYVASQDIAVVATESIVKVGNRKRDDRLLLFDTTNGRRLSTPSRFEDRTRQILGVTAGRFRDGPESIVVAGSGQLVEWAVDLHPITGTPQDAFATPSFAKDNHAVQYWQD